MLKYHGLAIDLEFFSLYLEFMELELKMELRLVYILQGTFVVMIIFECS